jgi:hypothetical protein
VKAEFLDFAVDADIVEWQGGQSSSWLPKMTQDLDIPAILFQQNVGIIRPEDLGRLGFIC